LGDNSIMTKKKNGFTLVELLVVITIIAVLAAAAIVSYVVFVDRSYESNANSTIAQIRRLLIDEDTANDNFEISDSGITFNEATSTDDLTAKFKTLYEGLEPEVSSETIYIVTTSTTVDNETTYIITKVIYKYSDDMFGVWDCTSADEITTPTKSPEGAKQISAES